ncbi:oxygen-dependent choline dehydrogenase [Tanacetum coccineum]
MREATNASKISLYDYIVIGGGTAEIPIATSLLANYSILLLERGGSPYRNANMTSEFGFDKNFRGLPSPDSTSQQPNSEGVINVRSRVLGGSTCINTGFYSHGEAQFNKEARLVDENLVHKSYEWIEKVMVFKSAMQKWQSTVRDALLEVGVTPDNGFTYDHITRTKVSGTIFDENGTRHTAADLLQYANPKGFPWTGRSRPLAYRVAFEDSLGDKHIAYLNDEQKDEIILSAGVLGSLQLLMLSGIGPRKQLDALNIKVVLEQDFVGKGMADNPMSTLFIPSPIAVNPSGVQIVGITGSGSYIETICGVNFIYTKSLNYQGFSPRVVEPVCLSTKQFRYHKLPWLLQDCPSFSSSVKIRQNVPDLVPENGMSGHLEYGWVLT